MDGKIRGWFSSFMFKVGSLELISVVACPFFVSILASYVIL